ncbi:hypothetical protein HZ326_7537 [Fusarium oxysporum f. sp. albedinis]|nr:hypothetical protein HZ326_7537 [Fusarium oxysporum f. sp. albedinis]
MYQSIRLRKFPVSPIKWAGDARGNKARQVPSVPFTPDFGGSLYQSFPLFPPAVGEKPPAVGKKQTYARETESN